MLTTQTRLPDLNETIIALSSAMGPGARAIVRLSGRRAVAIVSGICPELDRDRITPSHFVSGNLRLPGFAPIRADLYPSIAPRSYTGQDLLEIHLIACQPIIERLIAECLNAGARSAHPGEFTLRGAFLAGKLDLTRAEAVLGVIEAADRQDLQHALTRLAGGIAQPLQALRDDLLNLLADIEAGLDFTEENIYFVSADDLLTRLGVGLAQLTNLRRQIDQRALGQRPFRVVLAGRPNAGKSSLFNALVAQDAALVSDEPGTTRDYLEKTITIAGVVIELVDTAGLGTTENALERSAQALGQRESKEADCLLWCSACDDVGDASAIPAGSLRIVTKADLATAPPDMPATSAATGAGIPELRARLVQLAQAVGRSGAAPSLSRCRHHLDACLQHLRNAHTLVIHEGLPELLALELRLALEELGAIVGAVYTDDLLDRIFSRFCIGK